MVVDRSDQGGRQYLVHAVDVLEMHEHIAPGSDIRQLSEELNVRYDMVRQYIRRHPELDFEKTTGRDYRLSDEVADNVRTYFEEQRSLTERAVRMPEVAKELGISVAAVDTLIRHGRLVEDCRFHGGVRSVTKASLVAYQRQGRRRAGQRRGR